MGFSKSLRQRLNDVQRKRTPFGPQHFAREGSVSSNATGERSRVMRLRADTVHALRAGRDNPMAVSVPAYESFAEDGAANTETLNLSHDLADTPNTMSAVVYIGGSRYGEPDSYDYANDTIDVTTQGSGDTIHVWYVTAESATLEIQKALQAKSNGTGSAETLYEEDLSLVHITDQTEQPEYLEFSTEPERFIATDMTLDVYLTAPYSFEYTAEGGDAVAENLLLGIPGVVGRETVEGLRAEIAQDMAGKQA